MAEAPRRHDNGRTRLRETAYASHEWRKASEQYRRAHPFCVECGKPAQMVDHTIAHEGDQARFWDRSNWRSMCHSCHNKKTHGTCQ